MKKIVILASGDGTNAQAILDYFKNNDAGKVTLILTNNPHAGVLDRARDAGVAAFSFNKYAFAEAQQIQALLQQENPDLIVLAGFLWKVPEYLINDFPDKIINIHPALLPKYGGKGMYGKHVHEAVIAQQEKESGITIHYVNANYDEGAIIKQVNCQVLAQDTPLDLAARIHQLEHYHLPRTIEELLA
jgi:phosphoribosylglycinamide formyltransferase-1